MSAQPAKMYFDYLIGLAAAVTVLGFIFNYWSAAGSFASTIWQHLFVNFWFIWLGLGAYGAVRLVRFVRNFYFRFTKLEERSAAMETKIHNRIEAESKSRVASDEAIVMRFAGEIGTLRDDARAEVAQAVQRQDREHRDLERRVSELKDQLAAHNKREPSPAEILASRPGNGMLNRA